MCVYVEPFPSDYWLLPSEAVRIVGSPGAADVEVIRFSNGPTEDGLTVWFGNDPDPRVEKLDGTSVPNGYQRPS